ncbi:hypothetical protein FSARC_3438 [Fusarium sarcochroum]|uniref:Uncharacterized protein n=1 Tax=Fusarium sarcochroum TaxID=1208366 RepID=A0A8H4U3V7_9HYPO|nr:hypothetical protein FSARC_3438 [Fusarium sarcochroum]
MERDTKEKPLLSESSSLPDVKGTKGPSSSTASISVPDAASLSAQHGLVTLDVEALINAHPSVTQEQKDAWLVEWALYLDLVQDKSIHYDEVSQTFDQLQAALQSTKAKSDRSNQEMAQVKADHTAIHAAIDRLEVRLESRDVVIRRLKQRLQENNLPTEI